jgi:peptide/nickel transport system substrate-binding protein
MYENSSRAMWSILEAIYDGPIDTVNYLPEPVILEDLPTLENNGVTLSSVSVTAGDEVANVEGDLVALAKGVKVFPEGCTSPDCATEWDGQAALSVVQMSARFTIKPGITWSDGQALTAEDSVFSYTVSVDPATDVTKNLIRRTASYTVVDAQTVEWTGIPGYLTMNPGAFFWIPMPKHILGEMSADQLNDADETNKFPLGWGPYVIDEWVAGDHIRMVKNELYFRAGEGLPAFDVLVYRFIPALGVTDLSPLVTGECDIMETSAGLESQVQPLRELDIAGETKLYFGQGPEWELINFGINPASFDDVYNPYLDRANFFGDLRVRQAFAACIDRETIIKEVLYSQSQIPATYLPANHPYAVEGLATIPHDTARGISLLEEVGWMDKDGDPATPRESSGISGILNGTPFSITYNVTESPLHSSVTDIVVSSLAECGIEVTPQYLTVEDMFAAGPDGVVFGRAFDLAELAWSTGRQPPCFLYSSAEIPGASNSWLGTKFGGVNIPGYENDVYDTACSRMFSTGLDTAAFTSDNETTQRLIAEDLPVLPLFYHLKVMAARVDLCGVSLDVSARSGINHLESYSLTAGTCP